MQNSLSHLGKVAEVVMTVICVASVMMEFQMGVLIGIAFFWRMYIIYIYTVYIYLHINIQTIRHDHLETKAHLWVLVFSKTARLLAVKSVF